MTKSRRKRVPVAQWIEQLPSKQWAVSSNLTRDASLQRGRVDKKEDFAVEFDGIKNDHTKGG